MLIFDAVIMAEFHGDHILGYLIDECCQIAESAGCSVSQPGEVTVPAHTIYEVVRKLPDGAEVEDGDAV